MSALSFHERMSGTYTPVDGGGPRAFSFDLDVRAASLLAFLFDKNALAGGRVHMEGVAREAALEGQLHIDPWLGRVIRYELRFDGDDGRHYRFQGQKDVTALRPIRSMTDLPGTLDDGERVVATARLYFDLWDLPSFLLSFRLGARA